MADLIQQGIGLCISLGLVSGILLTLVLMLAFDYQEKRRQRMTNKMCGPCRELYNNWRN